MRCCCTWPGATTIFVRAYANLAQFAGASSFYTWIWRLARNRALDLLARKRAHNLDLEPIGSVAPGPGPAAALEDAEQRDAVRAALATLPPDQREVLLLREFDGLDYQQIADALELPEGTVKSRLNRARAALRDRLAGIIAPEDVA
jgi:RNA polymerase sigma-70 factor (ECF subfamily)